MIKKSVFEDEIISNMQKELTKTAQSEAIQSLDKAVDDVNSAIVLFEDLGMTAQADQLLNVLVKIAKKGKKDKSDKFLNLLLKEKNAFDFLDGPGVNELVEEDLENGASCHDVPSYEQDTDLLAADFSEFDFEDEM